MRRTRLLLGLMVPLLAVGLLTAAGCGDDEPAAGAATATDTPASTGGDTTAAPGGTTTLLPSTIAIDDAGTGTATVPLFKGVGPDGADVWYVVTESSDEADAEARGVIHAPKLANALGTKAVQKVTLDGETITFAGGVDFSPERAVAPGPDGFPPASVTPGAVGDAAYSPLVSPDGRVVLNATQVMNASGRHDGIVDIDTAQGTVTLKTLHGWFNGSKVAYFRLDASVDVVAALEESILAPNLNAAPGAGSNESDSSRSAIIPIVNGVRGKDDPDRQGLQSAVLGTGEPLNITQSLPGAPDYSPIWDVSPAIWSEEAIAGERRVLVTGNQQIADAVRAGDLTSAGMGPAHAELGGLRSLDAVSNCPTVAIVAS